MTQKKSPLDDHLKKMKDRRRSTAAQKLFDEKPEATPTATVKKEDPYVSRSFHTEPPPATTTTVKKKRSDDY